MKNYKKNKTNIFRNLILSAVIILPITLSAIDDKIIDNPLKHFAESHHIPDNSNILYFNADISKDKKQDYFITSDNAIFNNGQLGRLYSVYLSKDGQFLWDHENCLTINYDKIFFSDYTYKNYKIPFLLIEEDSVWAFTCKDELVREFKLIDIKWGKYPQAPDIIHTILKKDTKLKHPLTILSIEEALNSKIKGN